MFISVSLPLQQNSDKSECALSTKFMKQIYVREDMSDNPSVCSNVALLRGFYRLLLKCSTGLCYTVSCQFYFIF
jgi:hypothetical protein